MKESDEESKKKSRNKFLACMFMDGANKTKYGKCIADLSNSYLSKNDKYPKTVATALTYLSHFSDGESVPKKKPAETINLGFVQTECVISVEKRGILQPIARRTKRS